ADERRPQAHAEMGQRSARGRFRHRLRDKGGQTLTQLRGRVAYDLDAMGQRRFAGHADGTTRYGVDGDVPETGVGDFYLCRKLVERTAVVGMTSAISEAAKVLVVHQANIAGLRALDDHIVIFIEVFALVNELHVPLRTALLGKAED